MAWFLTIFVYNILTGELSVNQHEVSSMAACRLEASALEPSSVSGGVAEETSIITYRCTELVYGTERKLLES